MPSSTTSSDQRLPRLRWRRLFPAAAIVFAGLVAGLELLLAAHGVRPTVTDSEARWDEARNRASDLGAGALVLVGASQMQMDVDLAVARAATKLEPVQLAVAGANWIPILAGLAADADVRGTVLVDLDEKFLADPEPDGALIVNDAQQYQLHFRRRHAARSPSDAVEQWLSDGLHMLLRSYADDATPWQSLRTRAFADGVVVQYVTTTPDRQRIADFSRTSAERTLPRFLVNGGRHIPLRRDGSLAERTRELERAIASLHEEDDEKFLAETREIRAMAAAIRARGGRVYFVRMPVSGWLREAYARRFPRTRFWDRFAAEVGAPSLHYEDVPTLAALDCPDATHLDARDRAKFTSTVIRELGLERGR